MTPAAFLAVWLLHLAAAASPGPSILMTARTGVAEGFRAAAWLSAGLGLGAVLWALAALFGLALLFELAPALLRAFKVAGGLFLIWIAVQMWRHSRAPLALPEAGALPRGAASAFRLGLFTQMSNPKPAVFFGAVFLGTLPAGTGPGWIAALLALIFVNEVACNLAVGRAFSLPPARLAYERAKAGIDRAFGGVLALVGTRIAVT